MSESDEHWALVDLLKEIIEDSRDEPHFTVAEHALMGHGRIRDEWLAAHDGQVRADERERIAQAIEAEAHDIDCPCSHVEGLRDAARITRGGDQ